MKCTTFCFWILECFFFLSFFAFIIFSLLVFQVLEAFASWLRLKHGYDLSLCVCVCVYLLCMYIFMNFKFILGVYLRVGFHFINDVGFLYLSRVFVMCQPRWIFRIQYLLWEMTPNMVQFEGWIFSWQNSHPRVLLPYYKDFNVIYIVKCYHGVSEICTRPWTCESPIVTVDCISDPSSWV